MSSSEVADERSRLASLIDSFLNDKITAFEFDELLKPFGESNDSVSKYVSRMMYYFYDDCEDHHAVLKKREWDFIQRLQLMLATDSQLSIETDPSPVPTRSIALTLLAAFAVCFAFIGWNWFLTIPAAACGVAALWLQSARQCLPNPDDIYRDVVFPFASLADLEKAYRLSAFRKTQYRRSISDREIRNDLQSWSIRLHRCLTLPMWGPLVLLLELVPDDDFRRLVRTG